MAQQSSGISKFWQKSSASDAAACVEVRRTASGVQVRDSKNPGGAMLDFTDAEWIAFLRGVALGEFDIPGPTTQHAVR